MTDPNAQLQTLRSSIDNIDAALVFMLAERFRCTKQVGVLKAEHGMPASDPSREEQQTARLRRLALEERDALLRARQLVAERAHLLGLDGRAVEEVLDQLDGAPHDGEHRVGGLGPRPLVLGSHGATIPGAAEARKR